MVLPLSISMPDVQDLTHQVADDDCRTATLQWVSRMGENSDGSHRACEMNVKTLSAGFRPGPPPEGMD